MGSSGSDPGAGPVLVGITTYTEPARWGVWDEPAVLLPRTYADLVAAAGGTPVLLPPLPLWSTPLPDGSLRTWPPTVESGSLPSKLATCCAPIRSR